MLYSYRKFQDKEGIRHYEIPELNFKKLPSSTTITGQLNKPALVQWAANMAIDYVRQELLDKIESGTLTIEKLKRMDMNVIIGEAKRFYKKTKEEAANLGTRVHQWIQAYFLAEPGLEIRFDPDMEKPIMAFHEWYLKNKVIPIKVTIQDKILPAIEIQVWSKEGGGYAGTLDLVATLTKPGDTQPMTALIDFKTSSGIYDEMVLQVSSYYFAFKERFGIIPDVSAIIRLDKKSGMPEFFSLTQEENERAFKKFILLCEYWHCDDFKRRIA